MSVVLKRDTRSRHPGQICVICFAQKLSYVELIYLFEGSSVQKSCRREGDRDCSPHTHGEVLSHISHMSTRGICILAMGTAMLFVASTFALLYEHFSYHDPAAFTRVY